MKETLLGFIWITIKNIMTQSFKKTIYFKKLFFELLFYQRIKGLLDI